MGIEVKEEIRVAADAVLQKAAASGELGGEAHLRAVARESLIAAGIDPQWIPERPIRDDIIAKALEEAEGLTLFEIEFVWAICSALAQHDAPWRTALVLPLHSHEYSYAPTVSAGQRAFDDLGRLIPSPQPERRDIVRVRGQIELEPEDWTAHVAAEGQFALIFAAALSKLSGRFLGIVETGDELRDLAGDGPVGQLRIVGRSAAWDYYDPIGELQLKDDLWAAVRDLGRRSIDIIAWQCEEVDGRGYDLGHLRGDPEHLDRLELWNLREVVQLPEGEQTQLFIWDGSYNGPVEMTTVRDGSNSTVAVFPEELRFRLDYTPSHYSYDVPDIRMSTLRTLTRKVQRGTSLNGKSLQIVGTVNDPRPGARLDLDSMALFSETDLYYVDNASITGHAVRPRVIAEIPAGQDRYTLLPEDGTVVLVARNGKGSACYTAKRPTLVSNNLFIVWPNQEKAAPEYLSCAMRSALVRGEMRSIRMPMGKADLERILVPVGPKRLMDAVVERELQIRRKIAELTYELDLLRIEEPLDQLWAKEDEEQKKGGQQ